MMLEERTRACGYVLAVVLGMRDEIERRADDAWLVERMLGLRSGQAGGLAAQLPPEAPPWVAPTIEEPDELRSAIAQAGPGEFALVRRMIGFIPAWANTLLTHFVAQHGPKAQPFAVLAREMLTDLPPGTTAYMTLAVLVRVQARAHPIDEVVQMVQMLEPGVLDFELLTALVPMDRRDAFKALPEHRRANVAEQFRVRLRPGSR